MSVPPGASVIERVAGGDINEAFRVRMRDGGEAFVKTRGDVPPGEYAQEAAALAWLAEPGALRTPRVLDVADGHLALEWIDGGPLDAAGVEELGRGLAATHTAWADAFGAAGGLCGADGAGGAEGRGMTAGFGWLRLPNEHARDWSTFYVERRLEPLTRMARDCGVIRGRGLESLARVCDRMSELSGPAERPARLHGDLWSGNVMADAGGRPWLIDPSSYGGSREVDLAMLRLFGAPSERVFDAYAEVAPLAVGWRDRVELYQLLPLLVHALLFGGSYVAAAERVAARYA